MELELGREHIEFLKPIVDTCTGHEENVDMIVPDASPDIMRILGAFGDVFLKEETARENQYSISGMISGWVLYVSEGDFAVRRLEINIPFNHVFDSVDVGPETVGCVTLNLTSLEAREINPRKITVRANVAICMTAYQPEHIELLCSIEDAFDYGVQYRTESNTVFTPTAVAKKNFILSDDIELPDVKPGFVSMLKYDAKLHLSDSKIIGSKAVIKGIADLKCTYLNIDGNVENFERELPYSQIIESDALDESCSLDVQMQMGDLRLEPQHDMSGDVHYLALNLPIKMCVIISVQNKIDPIVDLYSTRYPLDTRFDDIELYHQTDSTIKRVTLNEKVACELPVERVVDISVHMGPVHKRMDVGEPSLANGAFINVLYLTQDGILASAHRRSEVICPISSEKHEYSVKTIVDSISHSIEPGNEISIRCHVDFNLTLHDFQKINVLRQAIVDTDAPVDMHSAPSVVVKRINQGDTLWKLAKQYRTTVDEIMSANRLVTEDLTAGEMIAIPLRRR